MAGRKKTASCELFLLSRIALLMAAVQAHDPNALVITQLGSIQGLTQVISNAHGSEKAIHKFLGIPYAVAPLGSLRFAPPKAHKGWRDTVFEATSFKSICMQMIHHYNTSIRQAWDGFSETDNISEDCLYLNIYTPVNASKSRKPFPVLAYIHGGGFFAGTPIRAVSPGEYLAIRGIILVTIQYRLGPFGFFSTGDSNAPGNDGMLDQVEALRWINKNIEHFGGDPSRITLLGESAGGASANLHLLSPLSRGLFHRVITESGTDLSPFAFHDNSGVFQSSRRLAEKLDCADVKDTDLMLKCLRSRKAQEILQFAGGGFFYPVIDKRFLLDSPINLRKAGKFQKVPTMAGFVSDEGSFLLGSSSQKFDRSSFRRNIEMYIVNSISHSAKRQPLLVDAVLFQYSHWPETNNNSTKIRKSLIDAFTDYFIVAPTHASLTFQSQNSPTWLYEFRHRSKHSPKRAWEGVAHGDITSYVFGVPLLNRSVPHLYTEEDRNISDFMVSAYINFVKDGVPSPEHAFGIEWKNFDPRNQAYLRIEAIPHMAKNFQPQKVAFWNDYFPKLYKSVMRCEGHDVSSTKSFGRVNKFSKRILWFMTFLVNIWTVFE